MYTPYFIAAIILFILMILVQLIRTSSFILSMSKDKELKKMRIKEEKDFQFIKGLY